MPRHTPGERVAAILGSDKSARLMRFLGYGVYDGEFPVDDHAQGLLAELARDNNLPNPRITLDNGDVVWGCECWWGAEATLQPQIEQWRAEGWTIEVVRIAEVREEHAKAAAEAEADALSTEIIDGGDDEDAEDA